MSDLQDFDKNKEAAAPDGVKNTTEQYGPRGVSKALTDTMLSYLRGASPWIRFIGVISFISCGLLVVVGLMIAAFSIFMEDFSEYAEPFMGFLLGIFYIICGVVCIFPSRFLYNFGARIRNYLLGYSEQELELALKNNKALWKFLGVLTIISMILVPVLLVGGVILVALSE